jgi:tryptophan synthase alpha chain
MSYIKSYIENLNKNNKKALSVFLTSGFPDKENFISIAKNILDAGADMLELGIPFSDPLADGPVIQASSKIALDNGVNINTVLSYAESLAKYTNKPIILMGYANPIKKYGVKNFLNDAGSLGIKGLIVPDVPLEEYDSFFENMNGNLDIIQAKDLFIVSALQALQALKIISIVILLKIWKGPIQLSKRIKC